MPWTTICNNNNNNNHNDDFLYAIFVRVYLARDRVAHNITSDRLERVSSSFFLTCFFFRERHCLHIIYIYVIYFIAVPHTFMYLLYTYISHTHDNRSPPCIQGVTIPYGRMQRMDIRLHLSFLYIYYVCKDILYIYNIYRYYCDRTLCVRTHTTHAHIILLFYYMSTLYTYGRHTRIYKYIK